jgi:hypothetical protein
MKKFADISGKCSVNEYGFIFNHDKAFSVIMGFRREKELHGCNIFSLLNPENTESLRRYIFENKQTLIKFQKPNGEFINLLIRLKSRNSETMTHNISLTVAGENSKEQEELLLIGIRAARKTLQHNLEKLQIVSKSFECSEKAHG